MLLNRTAEKEALGRVLAAAREGLSGVLVLRGDPGIGKTALLEHAIATAEGMQVTSVIGVESEMELGFAGLHRLLFPFLDGLERLPRPQRDALRSAFGLQHGVSPDRFLVRLAALTLLSTVAAERPLLCVVDDAHWLDQESAAAMGFVGRRLLADSVALLLAVPEPADGSMVLEGLPELRIGGLPPDEARELLASSATRGLSKRVNDRVISATRGNPLALVEFGGELTPDELSGRSRLPEPLRLGGRLEERFLARVQALPADAQTLLLLASTQESGDPALLWRAAEHLRIDADAARAGVPTNLLKLSPQIAFRHPLIRSAVYQSASPSERQRAHHALGVATDPELEPDRRAWHLAAATVGFDEQVAAELQRSADRAQARGGFAAAARFHTRSAELTPVGVARVRRLLDGAQAELTAGAPSRALALLDETGPTPGDPSVEARVLRLRGTITLALGQNYQAASLLLRAAERLSSDDPRAARDTLLEAMEAACWAGQESLLEVARAAQTAPPISEADTTAADLLLDGFTVLVLGDYTDAAALLRSAIDRLGAELLDAYDALRLLGLGTWAAWALFDSEAWRSLTRRAIELARREGALTLLPLALDYLGELEAYSGNLDEAEAHLAEQRDILGATGNPRLFGMSGTETALLAYRGREAELREVLAQLNVASSEHGQSVAPTWAEALLCQLDLGLGRYAEVLAWCKTFFASNPSLFDTWLLPSMIEAATRVGDTQAAACALARLRKRALASGTPWALGLLARSEALLAHGDDADALYEAALRHLGQCTVAIDLAWAHLVYGESLRRRRRRRDARFHLRTALAMFESMGGESFATRARRELLATGERAHRRTEETRDLLTPQETQVARLASDGASNEEIAAQMFISSNTVAYHLRKVYRKLGVGSRGKLRQALDDLEHARLT
jgi:DNA-binding CsgD family transcriptional regulator